MLVLSFQKLNTKCNVFGFKFNNDYFMKFLLTSILDVLKAKKKGKIKGKRGKEGNIDELSKWENIFKFKYL